MVPLCEYIIIFHNLFFILTLMDFWVVSVLGPIMNSVSMNICVFILMYFGGHMPSFFM